MAENVNTEKAQALYKRSMQRVKQGDYQGALTDLNEVIRLAPTFAPAYYNRGHFYMNGGQFDQAEADFQRYLSLGGGVRSGKQEQVEALVRQIRARKTTAEFRALVNIPIPGSAPAEAAAGDYQALLRRGATRAGQGDYAGAVEDYTVVIIKAPENSEAFRHRGSAYFQLNQPDKALADLTRAIDLAPGDAEAYLVRGRVYSLKGDWVRALLDLDAVVRLQPGRADALYHRGFARMSQGESELAIADLEKALALEPNHPDAERWQGVLRRCRQLVAGESAPLVSPFDISAADVTRLYEQAVASLERDDLVTALDLFYEALRQDPDHVKAYIGLGMVWEAKDDFLEAIANYGEAVQRQPQLAESYLRRGLAYARMGDYHSALDDFNELLRLDQRLEYYYTRADIHAMLGNEDAALGDYDAAIALYPKSAAAYTIKAGYLRQIDRLDDAFEAVNQALKLDANLADAYRLRGVIQGRQKQYRRALKDLDRAIRQAPSAEAWADRALVHLLKGDDGLALSDAGQALRHDPRQPTGLYVRGMVHARQGDRATASRDAAALEAIAPDFPDLPGLLDALHDPGEAPYGWV